MFNYSFNLVLSISSLCVLIPTLFLPFSTRIKTTGSLRCCLSSLLVFLQAWNCQANSGFSDTCSIDKLMNIKNSNEWLSNVPLQNSGQHSKDVSQYGTDLNMENYTISHLLRVQDHPGNFVYFSSLFGYTALYTTVTSLCGLQNFLSVFNSRNSYISSEQLFCLNAVHPAVKCFSLAMTPISIEANIIVHLQKMCKTLRFKFFVCRYNSGLFYLPSISMNFFTFPFNYSLA